MNKRKEEAKVRKFKRRLYFIEKYLDSSKAFKDLEENEEKYLKGTFLHSYLKTGRVSRLRSDLKQQIATAVTYLHEDNELFSWIPIFKVRPMKKSSTLYQKYLVYRKKDGWCWFSDISPMRPGYYVTKAGEFKYCTGKWDGMRFGPSLARHIYGKNIISRKRRNPRTKYVARQFKFIKTRD